MSTYPGHMSLDNVLKRHRILDETNPAAVALFVGQFIPLVGTAINVDQTIWHSKRGEVKGALINGGFAAFSFVADCSILGGLVLRGVNAAGSGLRSGLALVRRGQVTTLASAEAVITSGQRAGQVGTRIRIPERCFVAGTPLLTPNGHKPIEDFRPGDLILSRSDKDPNSPIRTRVVEKVFVRVGQILEVRVRRQVIGTTREHPFYVAGRGWTCAGDLKPGDKLCSHDGSTVRVESVRETGAETTVHNRMALSFP